MTGVQTCALPIWGQSKGPRYITQGGQSKGPRYITQGGQSKGPCYITQGGQSKGPCYITQGGRSQNTEQIEHIDISQHHGYDNFDQIWASCGVLKPMTLYT